MLLLQILQQICSNIFIVSSLDNNSGENISNIGLLCWLVIFIIAFYLFLGGIQVNDGIDGLDWSFILDLFMFRTESIIFGLFL